MVLGEKGMGRAAGRAQEGEPLPVQGFLEGALQGPMELTECLLLSYRGRPCREEGLVSRRNGPVGFLTHELTPLLALSSNASRILSLNHPFVRPV